MPRIDQIYAREQRASLRRDLGGAALTVIPVTLAVYERATDGEPCPCCCGQRARLKERRELFTIVVHRDVGPVTRLCSLDSRTSEEQTVFNDLVAMAYAGEPGTTVVPVEFKCLDYAEEDVLDWKTPVIYRSGYWQTGKTYHNLVWAGIRMLRFGGAGVIDWLLAPNLEQSYELFRKMFFGSATEGPLFPVDEHGNPRLLVRWPEKKTERELSAEWLWGSVLELHHGGQSARGLEGKPVTTIVGDEFSGLTTNNVFQIAKARLLATGGQMGISAVPKAECDWLYDDIVAPFEEAQLKGVTHDVVRMFVYKPYLNAFVPKEHIDRNVGKNPPQDVLDQLEGKWVRSGNKAYTDVWTPDTHAFSHESFDCKDWGFEYDVTKQVTREIFKTPLEFIGGQDFNFKPFTTVIAKIFAHKPDDDKTWAIVLLDEMTTDQEDAYLAAKRLATRSNGLYAGRLGLVCDANGFHKANAHTAEFKHERKTADALRFKEFGFYVESPIKGTPTKASSGRRNPNIGDSRTLIRRLMRERRWYVNDGKCLGVLAMLSEATIGRKRPNEAGNWKDRRVYNYEDSVRYLSWRVFSKRAEPSVTRFAKITGL